VRILHVLPTSGVSKQRPMGQVRPAKPFHPAHEDIFVNKEKKYIYETFIDFVECSVFRSSLRKMSGPRTVVQ